MSDKTEREYRQNMLTILDRFYRGRGQSLLTKDESEALDYAISSIKTDLKYDLLYEETTHIADADKMIELTTKNDLGVDAVSRKAVINQIFYSTDNSGDVVLGSALRERIAKLPSVTPQEPFINKPCISSGVCEHEKNKVLDKIRAEIERKAHSGQWSDATMYGMLKAVAIIDKYKADSEPQESEE